MLLFICGIIITVVTVLTYHLKHHANPDRYVSWPIASAALFLGIVCIAVGAMSNSLYSSFTIKENSHLVSTETKDIAPVQNGRYIESDIETDDVILIVDGKRTVLNQKDLNVISNCSSATITKNTYRIHGFMTLFVPTFQFVDYTVTIPSS